MVRTFFFLLVLLGNSGLCYGGAYTTVQWSWDTPPEWVAGGVPVIIRIYGNGLELCNTYDNLDVNTTTSYDCYGFYPDNSKAVFNARAEAAMGPVWQADTVYTVGDYIVASTRIQNDYRYFECVQGGTSGPTEPSWPGSAGVGTTINDPDSGGVQWLVRSNSTPEWDANQPYSIGDEIVPRSVPATMKSSEVYRCISGGTSGATEPVWPTPVRPWWHLVRNFFYDVNNDVIVDGSVTWVLRKRDGLSEASNKVRYFFKYGEKPRKVGRNFN